VLALGFG